MENEMSTEEGFKDLVDRIQRRDKRRTIIRVVLIVCGLITIIGAIKYFHLVW